METGIHTAATAAAAAISRFSRVRLCATPWTAAHQAPPSLGFSKQEHWNGLPCWNLAKRGQFVTIAVVFLLVGIWNGDQQPGGGHW